MKKLNEFLTKYSGFMLCVILFAWGVMLIAPEYGTMYNLLGYGIMPISMLGCMEEINTLTE